MVEVWIYKLFLFFKLECIPKGIKDFTNPLRHISNLSLYIVN